ncbi:hypothetical protein LIP_0951 [Limnochorda pilosa]|uniref:Uncharacterized protein n=1 Tax=Limnochorda pilosa TaxID=1555112 RepID=A0A0K2SI77_LIMPI|nr:hypothetical protein LIP_0951 [Limnochorda pilosa]
MFIPSAQAVALTSCRISGGTLTLRSTLPAMTRPLDTLVRRTPYQHNLRTMTSSNRSEPGRKGNLTPVPMNPEDR